MNLSSYWSRREFSSILTLLGVGAAVTPLAALAVTPQRSPYLDALIGDDDSRQLFIYKIVGQMPNEVLSAQYANRSILQQVRAKYGHSAFSGEIAVAVPVEPAEIGRGTKSRIYVFEEAFPEKIQQLPHLHEDLDVLVENIILNKALVDARYFSKGIPLFPVEFFNDDRNDFNVRLYRVVIDMLSSASLYKALSETPRARNSPLVKDYLKQLEKNIENNYNKLNNRRYIAYMKKDFIDILKREFKPSNILRIH